MSDQEDDSRLNDQEFFSDDEEDESLREEEDDDDDIDKDDEEEQPVKKKKKTAASMFIEEEAAVDDDEEEEFYDEDDDLIGEEEEIDDDVKERYLDDRTHREFDRRRQDLEDQDAEEIAAKIQERYKRHDYGRNYQEGLQEGDQRLLIPSVSDPKLWLVRCRPGREKDIVFNLMRKYFELEYSDHPLKILSAFCRDSLQGYIYIESDKQAFVQQAIDKMLNVYGAKLQLVPVTEMVDCLQIKKKDYQLNPGTWVRLKRGKYEGDLAQVLEVYETDETAKIKLVPRIDFSGESDFQMGKKRKKGIKPPKKLFNPDLIADKRSMQAISGGFIQHGGDVYDKKGFLQKTVKMNTLFSENIQPTLEEITVFSEGTINEENRQLLSLAQSATNQTTADDFQIGETVQVMEGALMNLVGVVKSVNKNIVTIQPSEQLGLDNSLQFPVHQLKKKFREGEHVKVQHGVHKDEMGMILNVQENIVTILSDTQMKPIEVFLKDLMRASDHTSVVATGTSQQFDVHDLVQLNSNEVGVVLKVEKDLLHILNQHGALLKIRPQQVKLRRDSRSKANSFATDAQNNSFSIGDVVQIQDPLRPETNNRRGTVLHIHRSFVFLHSREVLDNNGVFVSKTGTVVVSSSKLRTGPSNNRSVSQTDGRSSGYGRGGVQAGMHPNSGRGGFQRPSMGRRDPLLGKTVTVRRGPYKGYLGVVKDVIDGIARVELHTNAKIISINRDHVSVPGESISGSSSRGGFGFRPNNGGFDGGRTPMYRGGNFGMTPNPYGDGSKTPAWNTGSKTPAWNTGSKTPAWNSGSRTPGWQPDTNKSSGGFNEAGWGEDDFGGSTHNTISADLGGGFGNHTSSHDKYNSRGEDFSASTFQNSRDSRSQPSKQDDFSSSGGWGTSSFAETNNDPFQDDGGWGNAEPSEPQLSARSYNENVSETSNNNYNRDNVDDPWGDNAGWGATEPTSTTVVDSNVRTTGKGSVDLQKIDWLTTSIEVHVLSYPNRPIGVITSAFPDQAQVKLLSGGEVLTVQKRDLEPVMADKKQKIKFVAGEFVGQTGTLIGMDGPDGIVRIQDRSDFKLFNVSLFAKYHEEPV